jgi:hypothetical protein
VKIKTVESMASKNLETPPPKQKKEEQQPKEKVKQAVIPKTVLKDVMQASDKEVEGRVD